MKTLGLIINLERDAKLKYTKIILENIREFGFKVNMSHEIFCDTENVCFKGSDNEVVADSDIIICLGGDGTFLRASRLAYKGNKFLLGVNLGSLGFLTEIKKEKIQECIKRLAEENYQVEERIMLDTCIIRDGNKVATDIALNDVVVSRGALSRILHVKTYINNIFVDAFPGDGIILASPTGSTAYSMSAGGSIVEPNTDLIIVTPICSHTLNSRSIIATGERTVKVVIDENYCHSAMVTVDGQNGYEIRGGDIIETKKSSYTTKIIKFGDKNFFNVLRRKIYYRGQKMINS